MAVQPFSNELPVDFKKEANALLMRAAIEKVRGELGREYDLIIGGQHSRTSEKIKSANPAHPSEVVGVHQKAGREHVEPAMRAALAAFESWKSVPVEERAGLVFRTADAAGINKIYLTGYTPSPLDKFGHKIPQLAKVSLNAEDYIPWKKEKNVSKVIFNLRKEGYKIFAVEQAKNSIPYYKISKEISLRASARRGVGANNKVALIIGNEVRGLSSEVLKKCDKILEIPMLGRKESLNVSVAYGVVAYFFATTQTRDQ